ncbi:hypothetical protein ACLI4Q_16535 [Natrialbaceae archaeon A-CW1-1]
MTRTENDSPSGVRRTSSEDGENCLRFTDITERRIGIEIGELRARAEDGRTSVSGREVASPADDRVLLAPFVLGAAYVGIAILLGPGVFDTGASGIAGVVAYVLLGTLLFLSAWSTARLGSDARWRTYNDSAWNPNPFTYILGGALVLFVGWCLQLYVEGQLATYSLAALFGGFIIAIVLSSTVAGPVYVVRSHRTFEDESE